ncbi:COX assembly mitochondrial protein homolog isoform X1 [Ambystoma mexicanum]|uniref:COX assembly mitochondrial protein homolog isoform X1 n=1 Tax=Ambystoma mexicanum TaxID=8296 RepID=UPI0037E7152B
MSQDEGKRNILETRLRKQKCTEAELQVFADEVMSHVEELYVSRHCKTSSQSRTAIWSSIRNKEMAVGIVPRDSKDCRKMWNRLKAKVCSLISRHRRERTATGGGTMKPLTQTPLEEKDSFILDMETIKGIGSTEARAESHKHGAFTKCCSETGFLMVVKCREENTALKDCLTAYYKDPAFYEECKTQYLKEKEEFQRTGIPSKQRHQKVPTSM